MAIVGLDVLFIDLKFKKIYAPRIIAMFYSMGLGIHKHGGCIGGK